MIYNCFADCYESTSGLHARLRVLPETMANSDPKKTTTSPQPPSLTQNEKPHIRIHNRYSVQHHEMKTTKIITLHIRIATRR
jgi:hypothetical protein